MLQLLKRFEEENADEGFEEADDDDEDEDDLENRLADIDLGECPSVGYATL